MSNIAEADHQNSRINGIRAFIEKTCAEYIAPEDQHRYLEFLDVSDLWIRLKSSRRGAISQAFKYNCLDGDVRAKETTVIAVPGEGKNVFVCVKEMCCSGT